MYYQLATRGYFTLLTVKIEIEAMYLIKQFYILSGSKKALEDYIKKFYDIAIDLINDLELEENKKDTFKQYCSSLINRAS